MDISTAVSVSTLVQLLQELVEDNFVQVLVQGELSNVSQPPSGHYYFTLKDKRAQIKCVMFRSQVRALRFKPTDGLAVICRGRVSIYPQRGDLQLIVDGIEPEGVGALQLAFEQLKAKLEGEGLFAEDLKKPLPLFPQVVGVVTSSTGAAIQDILNVLRRRSAGLQVVIRSVRVQGDGAAAEIATAIADLNRETAADVLIVGRGGGAREDLWAFNEEVVARAIASSRIPVISAVGHETDFSIADLVADLRAPTPSVAAEIVVKNRLELESHLDQLTLRLAAQIRSRLTLLSSSLSGLEKRLRAPVELVKLQQLTLQQLSLRLQQGMGELLAEQNHRLTVLLSKLQILSPLTVLSRGYAIVKQGRTGEIVLTTEQLKSGDQLQIKLAAGEVMAMVTQIVAKGGK